MTNAPARISSAAAVDDAYVGRRVHQLLWDKKITQTAFGDRVGWDQSTVAKRLRGKLGWGLGHLVVAARELDTTVAYLVGETDAVGPEGLEPPASSVKSGKLLQFPTQRKHA
jgi:hypothetical protein